MNKCAKIMNNENKRNEEYSFRAFSSTGREIHWEELEDPEGKRMMRSWIKYGQENSLASVHASVIRATICFHGKTGLFSAISFTDL